MIQVQSKADGRNGKADAYVLWLLSTLWQDDTQLLQKVMPFILDKLEHRNQAEPRPKNGFLRVWHRQSAPFSSSQSACIH